MIYGWDQVGLPERGLLTVASQESTSAIRRILKYKKLKGKSLGQDGEGGRNQESRRALPELHCVGKH